MAEIVAQSQDARSSRCAWESHVFFRLQFGKLNDTAIQGCPVLYTTWTYVVDDDVEFTPIRCFDDDEEEKLVIRIESLREMFIDGCPVLNGCALSHLSKFLKLQKLQIEGISGHESSATFGVRDKIIML
ncbi:hypothetical protein LINGRAHAP2_LOCUS2908 [Linum grandiflorum]